VECREFLFQFANRLGLAPALHDIGRGLERPIELIGIQFLQTLSDRLGIVAQGDKEIRRACTEVLLEFSLDDGPASVGHSQGAARRELR
jgi:hypothetical protein